MKIPVTFKKSVSFFADFTLAGLLQYCFLKLNRKVLVVKGGCNCCGNCCRAINLEGPKGWIKSEKYFQTLLHDNSDFTRFSVIRKDETGHLVFKCSKLGEDNFCQDYESRPDVCRLFPDKRLPFCGGQLPDGCGYRFEEMKSFQHVLEKKMRQEK